MYINYQNEPNPEVVVESPEPRCHPRQRKNGKEVRTHWQGWAFPRFWPQAVRLPPHQQISGHYQPRLPAEYPLRSPQILLCQVCGSLLRMASFNGFMSARPYMFYSFAGMITIFSTLFWLAIPTSFINEE